MNRHNQGDCCNDLFTEFEFQDLRSASPPDERGICVIRIKKEGSSVKEIVRQVKPLVKNLKWGLVEKYMLSRISRLEKINQCPIIYIGYAGSIDNKGTLKKRYKEFCERHTVVYPLVALLYFGWDLEFGWKEEDDPKKAKSQLEQKYKEKHKNKLPALVGE